MKNTRNIGTFFSSSQVLMGRRKKKKQDIGQEMVLTLNCSKDQVRANG